LFHDEEVVGDELGGEDRLGLWTKLGLLATITNQLCFERDEWKEKMQHLTEELDELRTSCQHQRMCTDIETRLEYLLGSGCIIIFIIIINV